MPEAAAQAARTPARLESGLYLHRQKGGRMQSGMDGSDGENPQTPPPGALFS